MVAMIADINEFEYRIFLNARQKVLPLPRRKVFIRKKKRIEIKDFETIMMRT